MPPFPCAECRGTAAVPWMACVKQRSRAEASTGNAISAREHTHNYLSTGTAEGGSWDHQNWAMSNLGHESVIRNNTLVGGFEHGIEIDDDTDIIIENNYIEFKRTR